MATRKARKRRRARKPRPAVIEVPAKLEATYVKRVLKLLQPTRKAVAVILKEYAKRFKTRQDDAATDALRDLFAALNSANTDALDEAIHKLAVTIGSQGERFNREQFDAQLRSALGEGAPSAANLRESVSSFAEEQVNLIRTLPEEHLSEVEDLVLNAWENGTSPTDLAGQIQERWGVIESRANLIAEDQILTHNADMNQLRQTSVGVETYVWRSMEDSRVRPRHQELNGTTQRWDTPTDQGFPGTAIRCRCVAEPDFDSMLDELE